MLKPSWRRLSVVVAFVAALASVLILNAGAAGRADGTVATIVLNEDAIASGIDFVHQAPTLDAKVEHVAPHIAALGACVSVADFNNDGWPDLYFTSSRFGASNALYLNTHEGTFHDHSAHAGVGAVNRVGEGVSMGAVWGDYDNDGSEDLFVSKWGYQQLFKNNGNGTFTDVTAEAGLRRWMNSNGATLDTA